MASTTNQDDYIRTALRLPRDLHADVQAAAEKAGRSMNAEIIDRLSNAMNQDELQRDVEKYRMMYIHLQHECAVLQQNANLVAPKLVELEETKAILHQLMALDKERTGLIYGMLKDIAIELSSKNRTVESERDLLARILNVMTSFER